MTTTATRMRLLVALALAVAALGCGTSKESARKAAQSNADKYYELLKAGNPEGAYRMTFSERYRGHLQLETFLRYQERFTSSYGAVQEYEVTDAQIDDALTSVKLTYTLKTANVQHPVEETLRLRQEGSEWRIESVEPRMRPQPQEAPAG
jgi:hypothetical protein